MDFEFNQSSTSSGNGVTPVRTAGDVLVAYDLSQGGTVPTISVHFWDGSAWGPAQNLSQTGKATGSINLAAIPAAESDGLIATGQLDPLTFGEASVDVDAILPPGTCSALGSVYLKSRSSDSFTAALKDFIAPAPVNVSNCATITIRKVTEPTGDTTTSFQYDTTGGLSPASFSLKDGGVQVYSGVQAGAFSVTEAVDPAYELHQLTCVVSGSGTSATPNLTTATINITLAGGGSVDCTYTNDYKDHIEVDKVTIPASAQTSFGFSLTGPGGVNQSFSLKDQDPLYDSGPLSSAPGYAVSETPQPGWDLTSVTCTDGVTNFPPTNITAGTGTSVICTFTNTQRGHIIVKKVTDPVGSQVSFPFSLQGGPDSLNQSFGLLGGQQQDSGAIKPGDGYSVSEATPTGWDLTSATCDNGNSPSAITVNPGQTVTCTFNNRQRGAISILKRDDAATPNALAGAVFTLYNDNAPVGGTHGGEDTITNPLLFCTTAANGTCQIGNLVPGNYWVVETAGVNGYALAPDQPATVAAGATVSLTITDPRLFKVIVVVCRKSDNTAYPSTVTFDAGPTGQITLSSAQLAAAGINEAALCGVTAGALHDNVQKGSHSANIQIPQ